MLNRRQWFNNIFRYGLLALISGTAVYLSARDRKDSYTLQCNGVCKSCDSASNCDLVEKENVSSTQK